MLKLYWFCFVFEVTGDENIDFYMGFIMFEGARGASGPPRLQHYCAGRFLFNKGFSSAQREIQATSKIHLPGNIKLT